MPPGKPPRHWGVAHTLNNNGKPVKVSAEKGIASGKHMKLPTGEIVKKPRDPYVYLKPTHSVPKSPRIRAPPPVAQTTTLKHVEAYKPTGPGFNDENDSYGAKSPSIGASTYGGSRKRRRYTKRRGRR